jgi:GNAT acetyltransferase-like protein
MPTRIIEIQYLDKEDYPLWDEFGKSSPQGTFFCSIPWLQILEEVYNRPLKIIVCKRNQEIVSGIPFFENKRLFWKMITPVFLLPCDGPIFYSNPDAKPQKIIADQIKFLERLLKHLKNEYDIIQLKSHHSFNDLRGFTWNGFQVEPEHTYICKLENEQIILSRFSQSLRKKIQKSKELSFEISESKDVNAFADLYLSSYKRHGQIPPILNDELDLLLRKIIELQNVHLYFVENENRLIAGRIVLEDKETIYDLLAGSVDESGLASSFLVAEIMKKYAEKFTYFDFMGADHPEIEKFKRAFGGELVHRFKVKNMPGMFLNMLLKIRQKSELIRREI